ATPRIRGTVGRFGHARPDDYAWLRPRDWPAVLRDPATLEAPIRAQLDAENAYTEAMLAPSRPLQDELRARIEALNALRPADAGDTGSSALEGVPATQQVGLPDGRHMVWLRAATADAPAAVLRRDLVHGSDATLHVETDPAFALELRRSAFGRYVVIRSQGERSSEVRLLDVARPEAPPRLVEPRTPELEYDVDEWDGGLVVRSNADGAHDFMLAQATYAQPGRAHWRVLVPHLPGRVILGLHPFADTLVRLERRDALPRLVLMRRDGSEIDVAFDEPAYALTVPPGQDGHAAVLAFDHETPCRPPQRRVLDLASGRHAPAAHAPAPASDTLDPARFEVRRIAVRAADGAQIPVTLVMRRGQPLDGSAPLLLLAYGAYGLPIEAGFDPPALALVERGWVHAIAHVRGGGEGGAGWWHPTLRTGKSLTFDDYLACADALIADGYTRAGRLVGFGLSAGGTLMGVAANRRPDLWAGMIAPVAFMDVLTSLEAFEDHPLQGAGIPIWGDPRIAAEHAYVQSWSPYDHLRAQPYPAIFATAVVDDAAVSFWEPVKYVAKARALTTAANPILCHIASSGGHLSPWGAYPAPEQQAAYLAFAIWAAERRWGEVPQRGEATG
ncbi:prolyl oligopeptidase family serine peptidase, partial [Luteimonas sp. SDU101]|uniref:prolyl oligopeptidase family serine peptidase n=1 Tax=Luteimonas sp. SDU101 TaxID=3422593 RepID=UPI003EBC2FB2